VIQSWSNDVVDCAFNSNAPHEAGIEQDQPPYGPQNVHFPAIRRMEPEHVGPNFFNHG